MKQDIKELTLPELKETLKDWGEPGFRAGQILSWIYKRGVLSFDKMNNLPVSLRSRLSDNFYLTGIRLVKMLESRDGARKFLFELEDKNLIEGVTIPTETRLAGCLSTQVGCKFACSFCASGLLGFKRNLTSGEIIDEALFLKNNSPAGGLTHIVFMGTGEPLDNYDNVMKAIRVINSPDAFNIGARRITISTCGIIPGIKRLSREGLQIELSVSLHAADDKTRSQLLPINKKYPLKELLEVCKDYIKATNRQVTFEYILIKGINSSLPDARKLAVILKGMNSKVNLIPCNFIKEMNVKPPDKLTILIFKGALLKSGINATLRKPRGHDIEAACGQLRLKYEKQIEN